MDEATFQRSLRARPPADPIYRMRLTARPAPATRTAAGTSRRLVLTMTMLLTGLVVLAAGAVFLGSQPSPGVPLIPAERGVFSLAGYLTEGREGATATLLNDGRVLILGGYGASDAEVWDPTTRSFGPAGRPASERKGATATLLRDGHVLVVGGSGGDNRIAPAEVWTPSRPPFSAFNAAGFAGDQLVGHSATLLDDGRVLIVGGKDAMGDVLASAGIWDPADRSFSPTGSLIGARSGHSAFRLSDGRVLVVGSVDGQNPKCFDPGGLGHRVGDVRACRFYGRRAVRRHHDAPVRRPCAAGL